MCVYILAPCTKRSLRGAAAASAVLISAEGNAAAATRPRYDEKIAEMVLKISFSRYPMANIAEASPSDVYYRIVYKKGSKVVMKHPSNDSVYLISGEREPRGIRMFLYLSRASELLASVPRVISIARWVSVPRQFLEQRREAYACVCVCVPRTGPN